MSDNLVVLQQWFGELPNGDQVEQNSFQIILEGAEVEKRRGKGVKRLFVGFVGKNPTETIQYQPVIHAFRDLIPQIEFQIRVGLINWRKEQLAAAQELVDNAKKLSSQMQDDAISAQYAADALKVAEDNLATLTEQVKVEENFPRTSYPPSPEDIEAFLKSIREPAESAEAGSGSDEAADQQNL